MTLLGNDIMKNIKEFEQRFRIERRACDFTIGENSYQLVRIDDHLYNDVCRNSVVIKDGVFYLSLWLSLEQSGKALNLAETYVALKLLLGESGHFYDDWKSSFSFPCLLQINKPDGEFAYAIHIYDYKGGLEFYIRKLLDPDDQRFDRRVVHDLFYDEWFFKTVQCKQIVYGYQQGQFFEHSYDSEEEYKEAIETAELMQKLAPGKN